jgi:hypothetical protein
MCEEPLAKAHQAIGAYFCAFSALERELGESIKVVLRLEGNAAADTIVALIRDFTRKANIVREAVQTAKRADGTDPTEEWKTRADTTLANILGCNSPDRVDLAHDYLGPQPDGSLSLQKPGQGPRTWTSENLEGKTKKLRDTWRLAANGEISHALTPPQNGDWRIKGCFFSRIAQASWMLALQEFGGLNCHRLVVAIRARRAVNRNLELRAHSSRGVMPAAQDFFL